jgi:hypothetical protein
MQYGAQAIAQVFQIDKDEFTKCFVPKPRTTLKSLLYKGLKAPFTLGGIGWRYFVLFPIRFTMIDEGAGYC